MQQGRFITFEGPDGTGKSTQIERLRSWLCSEGHDAVITREPGGTAIGEAVRRIILDSRTGSLAPRAELALMFASRAQQIEQVIRPEVKAGRIVLCDRFTDSSEAYQGYGRKLGSELVLAMHHLICEDLQPDLTILLMFPENATAHSLARARQRNTMAATDESRFEEEGEAFQRSVAEGYRAIAARDPKRVRLIDASGTVNAIHENIVVAVKSLLTVS